MNIEYIQKYLLVKNRNQCSKTQFKQGNYNTTKYKPTKPSLSHQLVKRDSRLHIQDQGGACTWVRNTISMMSQNAKHESKWLECQCFP
jgi:hypothetical protein